MNPMCGALNAHRSRFNQNARYIQSMHGSVADHAEAFPMPRAVPDGMQEAA